ncbi:Uncharacterised protein [Mycobacteroides abscessus subsp. abscessus]|nr:Uncharacterised protein [Mycobacteroides abscessus subsp. abscessus]
MVPDSSPATASLPPTTTSAIAGNRACGNRVIMAHRSSMKVIATTGELRTKRSPSTTEDRPRVGCSSPSACCGTCGGSRYRAHSPTVKVPTSTRYVQP